MPVMNHYENVEAYINAQPNDVQPKLLQLRQIIRLHAPDSAECISYGMPAYKLDGKPLVYFAAQTKHIGLYALPRAVALFKDQLTEYQTAKGTIRFPLNNPLPVKLIKDIVKMRVADVKAAAKQKQPVNKKPSAATLKKG